MRVASNWFVTDRQHNIAASRPTLPTEQRQL